MNNYAKGCSLPRAPKNTWWTRANLKIDGRWFSQEPAAKPTAEVSNTELTCPWNEFRRSLQSIALRLLTALPDISDEDDSLLSPVVLNRGRWNRRQNYKMMMDIRGHCHLSWISLWKLRILSTTRFLDNFSDRLRDFFYPLMKINYF